MPLKRSDFVEHHGKCRFLRDLFESTARTIPNRCARALKNSMKRMRTILILNMKKLCLRRFIRAISAACNLGQSHYRALLPISTLMTRPRRMSNLSKVSSFDTISFIWEVIRPSLYPNSLRNNPSPLLASFFPKSLIKSFQSVSSLAGGLSPKSGTATITRSPISNATSLA